MGLGTLVVNPKRLCKLAVIVKPKTLLKFHQALKKHKYRLLFASSHRRRPGPKGPSRELIAAIVEMSVAIPGSAVRALHNRSPMPSVSRSTRTLFGVFSPDISAPTKATAARHG